MDAKSESQWIELDTHNMTKSNTSCTASCLDSWTELTWWIRFQLLLKPPQFAVLVCATRNGTCHTATPKFHQILSHFTLRTLSRMYTVFWEHKHFSCDINFIVILWCASTFKLCCILFFLLDHQKKDLIKKITCHSHQKGESTVTMLHTY